MRGMLIALATIVVMAAAAPSHAGTTSTGVPTLSSSSTVYALQVPDKKIDIDISTNQGGGSRWYMNPVWIAIGAVAAVVLLLLIVMAARGGGGTTIVKE